MFSLANAETPKRWNSPKRNCTLTFIHQPDHQKLEIILKWNHVIYDSQEYQARFSEKADKHFLRMWNTKTKNFFRLSLKISLLGRENKTSTKTLSISISSIRSTLLGLLVDHVCSLLARIYSTGISMMGWMDSCWVRVVEEHKQEHCKIWEPQQLKCVRVISRIDLLYSSLRLVTSAYMFPNGNILRLRSQAISIHHQRVTSDIFVHIEQTHVSWQRNVQLRSCACIPTHNLRKSAIMKKPTISILKSKLNLKTGVVQHLII